MTPRSPCVTNNNKEGGLCHTFSVELLYDKFFNSFNYVYSWSEGMIGAHSSGLLLLLLEQLEPVVCIASAVGQQHALYVVQAAVYDCVPGLWDRSKNLIFSFSCSKVTTLGVGSRPDDCLKSN
jgi:hypothetical protein